MRIKELFENWGITGLKVNTGFLAMDWAPSTQEKDAAWDLYVELVTRVATQELLPDDGDEEATLKSIFSIFESTRTTLKARGRKCERFSRIAVIVLNQKIRPFTAKWHKILQGKEKFHEEAVRAKFREELQELQVILRAYSGMLATIANVEDLTMIDEG